MFLIKDEHNVSHEIETMLDVNGEVFRTPPDDLTEVHAVIYRLPCGDWVAQEVGPEMLTNPKLQ